MHKNMQAELSLVKPTLEYLHFILERVSYAKIVSFVFAKDLCQCLTSTYVYFTISPNIIRKSLLLDGKKTQYYHFSGEYFLMLLKGN